VSDFGPLAARALSSAFATFGQPAQYQPIVGSPVSCRVIESKADEETSLRQTSVLASQRIIEVRASEVARPENGAKFLVGAYYYVIVAQPKREDPDGLVWTCLCKPEPADGSTPWVPLP
jgi:ribosomal protein S8E